MDILKVRINNLIYNINSQGWIFDSKIFVKKTLFLIFAIIDKSQHHADRVNFSLLVRKTPSYSVKISPYKNNFF